MIEGPEPVRLRTADGIVLAADYYADVSDTSTDPAGSVGSGPSYLLGHGFTGSSRQPRVVRIAQALRAAGGAMLALNFRGHGASGGRSTIGVDEIADVAAGVDWLRARRPGAPVVLAGFSMGASIVIRYAGLGGAPDAVVAVSGPGRWYERGTESMRRLHLGVETRIGRLVLHRVHRTRIGGGWDVLPASPVEVVSGITAPLLLVHGDADPYFGLEHPRMLAAAAPHAELWIEAGLGHAETAMTDELLDRIAGWAHRAVEAPDDDALDAGAPHAEAADADASATMNR